MDHYSHLIAGVDFINDDDCFFLSKYILLAGLFGNEVLSCG